MSQIEQTISNLIQSQFPAFYNEEGPVLIAFIQAYYEWMEQQGNPIYQSRNLLNYIDIDNTLEEFIVYFTNTYLQGIQFDTLSDKRLTVKKILDLYRAKGNVRALKLLFQLVFKEDIEVYLPATDILKPSDGTWTVPKYLEVSSSPRNMEYLGKKINGVVSGATAFVDRIVTRKIGSKLIYIFFLTNVSEKDFITGELLNVNNDMHDVPIVIGSLSSLIVDQGGQGFSVGDIVDLTSNFGQEGTARVATTQSVTGIVSFNLVDGGWGYSTNSNILISNTVLYLGSVNSTVPTSQRPFEKFSNVVISIPSSPSSNLYVNAFGYSSTVNVYATPITGTFIVNEPVVSADGNANGIITTAYSNNYTLLTLSNYTGKYQYNEIVYQPNTSANVAIGTVLVSNATSIIVATTNGAFNSTLSVKGYSSGANANVVATTTTITTLGVANLYESYFGSGQTITGLISGATANVLYFNTQIGITGLNGSLSGNYTQVSSIYPAYVTVSGVNGTFFPGEYVYQSNGSANIATATILGSNSTAITVSYNSGSFTPTTGTNTGIQLDTSNATISSITSTGTLTASSNNITSYGASLATTITSATLTNNSANISVSSNTGIFVGQAVYSPTTNFANGVLVANIVGTTIITSTPYFGTTNSSATVTFSNIAPNAVVTSTTSGLPANTTVYSINSSAIVLNSAFTGTTTIGASLTFTELYGSFLIGEGIYQSNGTANVAAGILLSANSSTIVYNTISGAFTANAYYNIVGGISGANATISSITYNTSTANATITAVSSVQTVNATLLGYSSGINANIAISSINSTETLYNYTDKLSGKNISNIPFLMLPLNSSAFGFPLKPSANLTSDYLTSIFAYNIINAGEIETIITTNPGKNYTDNPYVEIYEPAIASAGKRDYIINVANTNNAFIVGEEVTQNVALSSINELVLTTNSSFIFNEQIYQINSTPSGTYLANTANTILIANTGAPNFTTTFASGQNLIIGNKDIRSINNIINSTALYLNAVPSKANSSTTVSILAATGVITNLSGNTILYFSNTGNGGWTASQNVFGLSSGNTSNVSSVLTTVYGTALGRIKSANSTVIKVKRLSVMQDFVVSGNGTTQLIVGSQSGSTTNAIAVSPDLKSAVSGDNANVTSRVITGNGTVSSLIVQSSGIGYVNAESVVFTAQDGSGRFGLARTVLGKQGTGTGYYSSTKGFLSDNKYIQDGFFYQNFSYEVKSSLDLTKYYTMVRDVVHTAGTALYGAVVKKTTISTPLSITNSNTGPILG